MINSKRKGFSLPELLIVVVLIALLSFASMSSFSRLYQQRQLEGFTRRLANAIMLAQALSLTRHEDLIVCALNNNTCVPNWQGDLVLMTKDKQVLRNFGFIPSELTVGYQAFSTRDFLLIQYRGLLLNNGTFTIKTSGKYFKKITLSKQGIVKIS